MPLTETPKKPTKIIKTNSTSQQQNTNKHTAHSINQSWVSEFTCRTANETAGDQIEVENKKPIKQIWDDARFYRGVVLFG